jgi:uncharacterized protein YndB with AHSA1/START domain
VVIDAAPEQVFDSMTQPEQFCRWFGANVDIEPYVGDRFAMGGFELDPGGAKFVEFGACSASANEMSAPERVPGRSTTL